MLSEKASVQERRAMRIPYKNVYRAFPELDRFSDVQCDVFFGRVLNHPGRALGLGCLPFISGFFVFLVTSTVVTNVPVIPIELTEGVLGEFAAYFILLVGSATVVVGGTCLAGFTTRDMLYRRWVLRAVRDRINSIRCGECKYALLGLPVIDAHVTCPECGHRVTLAALGVESAEDLLPSSDVRDEFCPTCSGDLGMDLDHCQACGWTAATLESREPDG